MDVTTLLPLVMCCKDLYNTMRHGLGVARLVRLGGLGLREGVGGQSLLLGLHDGHVVGQRLLGADLAAGIPRQHDLDLDAEHPLPEQDVSAGHVHILVDGISGVDHQTVNKLHGLSSLSPQLAADNNLAALGSRLHDETENTIASPPHGQTSDQLVTERLGLGNGAKSASGHLLGVELDSSLGEVEPLLDDAGQLPDPPALLSQNVLGPGGHDDDLGPGGSHADLDTGVAILGELSGEELIELGFEDSVSNKLSLLRHLCRHSTLSGVEVNQAIVA